MRKPWRDGTASMQGIRPLQRRRLYQDIVEQMQELFRREEFRPGDRLPTERELADRFGVSRATMREAMSVLQSMGLVDSRTGEGTFAGDATGLTVAPASDLARHWERVTEPLEVRRILEPETSRLSAKRAAAQDLADIEDWLLRQERSVDDSASFLADDEGFHAAIARASKNHLLITISEAMLTALRESRRKSIEEPGATQIALAQHRRIFEAIRSRDARGAQQAMRAHLETVEGTVKRQWVLERSH